MGKQECEDRMVAIGEKGEITSLAKEKTKGMG